MLPYQWQCRFCNF